MATERRPPVYDVGFQDVTGAVVGQVYHMTWRNVRQYPTVAQQAQGITDTVSIYNESGCGFLVTLDQTQRSFTLPAGGWIEPLAVGVKGSYDTSLTLLVQYVLPNAAVNQVHIDYFEPSDTTSGLSHVLGNSPVNLSAGFGVGVVASATQVTINSAVSTAILSYTVPAFVLP